MKPGDDPPQQELVPRDLAGRAAAGDEAAFADIVARTERIVFALARRMCNDGHLARDVSQDVFLQLYRRLSRYDPTRPFMPWFMTLATHCCINSLKLKRNRRRKVLSELSRSAEDAAPELAVSREPAPLEQIQSSERGQRLRALVAALPENYSSIVALRYLRQHSVAEIATMLDMPVGTVKVRLFRARDILRRRLGSLPGGTPEP
jgi:RNA polymerase sigma-70 factor, ECF subfamily